MLAVKKILILCGGVGFLEEYIPVLLAWKDVREYLKKYIGELYTIAVGKHFRKNQEDKHKRDAKNGWYRYDSRFALPVYDEVGKIERYNVFHASLIIRHSEDSKLYLYDILDIKKETSNPIEP